MKTGLLAAGLVSVVALASTAWAGPNHRSPNGDFDRVGRWSSSHVQTKKFHPRTYQQKTTIHTGTTKAPSAIQQPRKYGDIVEGRPVLTGSTKARVKAAQTWRKKMDRKMYKVLKSRVEQKMKCVDSSQCGSFAPKNLKKRGETKANLVPNKSKVDKRLQIKYRKLEGMMMPSLECSDMAECL